MVKQVVHKTMEKIWLLGAEKAVMYLVHCFLKLWVGLVVLARFISRQGRREGW